MKRVERIEDRLLVLLHVLIIGKRQALHDREKAHQVAVNAPGLSADELRHIRVFLLRHDGRARGVRVVELNEFKLPAAPGDDLLAEPAQVHHENGCGRQEFQRVVPVGYAVERVSHRSVKAERRGSLKAVDGIRRSSQRAGAQRTLVHALLTVFEPCDIAREHARVGQKMLRKRDRLRPLQMRVAGHDGLLVFLCLFAENRFQLQQVFNHGRNFVPEVEAEIERDLIVAASCRVQALSRVSDSLCQKRLDVHVDILVVRGKFDRSRLNVRQNTV